MLRGQRLRGQQLRDQRLRGQRLMGQRLRGQRRRGQRLSGQGERGERLIQGSQRKKARGKAAGPQGALRGSGAWPSSAKLTEVAACALVVPLCGMLSVDLENKLGAGARASQFHRDEGREG